jgi:HEAT repeat protein
MQKEHDESYKRHERDEQQQEKEAETAQAALQPARTLAEHVVAYRGAMHSDPRIARLHVLEMTHTLEVEDSYQSLRLRQHPRPGYELDWVVQSKDPHALMRANRWPVERRARIALVSEHELYMYKRCVIVGAPGIGKTTLLKYLALQATAQQLRGLPDLPIYIELPAFGRSGHRDLLTFAAAVWEERYGFPQAQALNYIQEQLQNGDALLLLDGFDEMKAETTNEQAVNTSDEISKAITDVATRYPHAPIVVTARKVNYHQHTHLAGFAELEVLDARPEESKQFVERWFASHPDLSRRGNVSELHVKLERTPHLRTLAANPLLLSMMLIVYEDRRSLPERRAELYDQYVDTQLTKWDASRTLRRIQAFKPEHHHQLLERVAWHFHQQGRVSFPDHELLEVIAAYLPTIGLLPEQNGQVLAEIAAENGLLQEQARGWYGFVHLTFQEYFVALYTLDHQELDLLLLRREDPWWEAVLLFYAGRISDASLLVQHLLGLTSINPLQDDLFHTNLILAGHCLAAADVPVRHNAVSQEVITRLFQVLKTTRYTLTQTQVAKTLAEVGDTTVNTQLLQLLSNEQLDWQLRERIAEALGQPGERSIVPRLVQLLIEEQLDARVLQSIKNALGQIGERSSRARLLHLLSDERVAPRLRQQIAEAFGKLEEHSVAPQLVQMLSDKQLDWQLRESIAYALSQLGERSVAPQLVQMLSDEQVEYALRQHIAYALGQLGEHSIASQLARLLSDEQLNTYVRQSSAEALGELGERSVASQLVQLLSDRQLNPRVRGSTAVGLAQLGEHSIAPQLLQLLTDRKLEQSVRQSSAEALGRSGDRSMIPQLVQLVSDRQLDQSVRATIAHALGQIGGRSVAPQLVQLLSDEQLHPQVRESIVYTLGQLGERSIASQLVQLLSDERLDWSVRGRLPHVLGQLGERSIRPQLLLLFSDEQLDWSMRLQIAEALGQLGERLMVPQLVQMLSEEQLRWPVRQEIARAIGHLNEQAIASQLVELLSDEQLGWPIRQSIAYALGQLGERSVAPQLVELLSDKQLNSQVRESIAYALGQLGERSVASQLVQLLSDKQLDAQLHERIVGALGRIGEPSVVPGVVQLLSDKQLDSRVRQCIAEAVSTLATDEAAIQALAALLPTSDMADNIHQLLWAISRQVGVRIIIVDRHNGNSDQMAFRIERI